MASSEAPEPGEVTSQTPAGSIASDLADALHGVVERVCSAHGLRLALIDQPEVSREPRWPTVAKRLSGDRFLRLMCGPAVAGFIARRVLFAPSPVNDPVAVRGALLELAAEIAEQVDATHPAGWPRSPIPTSPEDLIVARYSTVALLRYACHGSLLEVAALGRIVSR